MALKYKLEFNYNDESPSDDAVYVHLKRNVPIYKDRIDKEEYDALPAEDKHPWLTGIFDVDGVTEISSRAYRVWVMKSPIYSWTDVNNGVLLFMKEYFAESQLEALPGSASIDGTGTRLDEAKTRRRI